MECCRHTNAFRLCSGLRVLGYLMLLLVAAIVCVSYYSVVVVVWGPRLLAAGRPELFVLDLSVLLLFHILLALLLWSYLMAVFNDPGTVPENWRPFLEVEGGVEAIALAATLTDHVTHEARASEGSERRPAVGYCSRSKMRP